MRRAPGVQNLEKISHVIPRALAAAIRARDSSGRIAAADGIADATIAVADRIAAADGLLAVSNAAVLAARTAITAGTPARRDVHN